MSSKSAGRELDAVVMRALRAAGLTDTATIKGTQIEGRFRQDFLEEGFGDDAVAGMYQAFDCREDDLPALEPEDIVQIAEFGKFRYLRREPGEAGRVLLILGSLL